MGGGPLARERTAALFGHHGKTATGEVRIVVQDQIEFVAQEAVHIVDEVSADLHHPRASGVTGDAGNLDPARAQLDDEQHLVADETKEGEHFDGEEVGGGKGLPVGLEEGLPRRLPSRSGAGTIPASFRMRLMVLRLSSCPRFRRAPRILV